MELTADSVEYRDRTTTPAGSATGNQPAAGNQTADGNQPAAADRSAS